VLPLRPPLPLPFACSVSALFLFPSSSTHPVLTCRRNTFGIPEVPREPCLLLCPQTILLGLAFADKAFQPDSLTSPEALNALTVPNASNQLLLPWKLQKLSTPLFSGSRRAKLGRLDEVAAWTDDMLRSQLRKLGQVTGIELPVGPYCFRRGAGEALDNSSKSQPFL